MEIFQPWLNGDILYFDLDTMITGNLDQIASVGKLTAVSDFYRPGRLQSCMMFIPWEFRAEVWKRFTADPIAHMRRIGSGGDQDFLEEIWGDKVAWWQDEVPGQVCSYKVNVRDKGVPEDARVVCFHGQPKPRDVGWKL